MKKLISLMLVLAMCVLAFASCGACEHKDADKDYKCDECGEALEKPDTPDTPDNPDDPDNPDNPDAPTAPLTADEWAALFTYTNVTVSVAEQGVEYADYRFVGGNVYMGMDDDWMQVPSGYEGAITYMFNFADDFAKFELKDGVYTSTEGITLNPEFTHGDVVVASNIRISVSGGKITSIVYDWTATEDGDTDTGALSFTFADYGTTVAPDVSGPAPEGGGIGGGAVPDPNPDQPDDPSNPAGPTGELSEAEWRALFDFDNVTIDVKEVADGEANNSAFYLYDGSWYASLGGTIINVESFMGGEYVAVIESMFDFSDDYASFRYEHGHYVCDKLVISFTEQTNTLTNIVINISDGKIRTITYLNEVETDEYTYVGDTVCELYNYGTTELPDAGGNGETSTYTGSTGVEFDYPSNFERDGLFFTTGLQAFSVQNAFTDSVTVSMYQNLDDASFEANLLASYEEELGTELVEWHVFTYKSDYDVEILVIEYWIELEGMEMYQAELYVFLSESSFVQIDCMTVNEVSDDFIGVIADSIRYTE